MIVKSREKSQRLLAFEAAIRRVPKNHEKYPLIEKEHGKLHYGFVGEKALDFFLTFHPNENTHILHGIRLADPSDRYFQMDTLLITPSYCVILDAKYISGVLELDLSTNQLIRHKDDQQERIGDPIAQISRQKYQLSTWMQEYNFPPLPIHGQIVLSHPNATLINTTPYTMKNLTFHTNLPTKLNVIDKKHPKQILEKNDLRRLIRTIKKKHVPDHYNLLSNLNIPYQELIKGIFCPSCCSPGMKREKGNWMCLTCTSLSKIAHVPTILDYKLLIGRTITNQQLRDFLKLSSASIAKNILVSLNLPSIGTNRGKTYILDHFHI
ncbi:nuclease-related domain-containing protein [Sutcliffiella rhizosphaerae]|uniref:NERD domain-containing protein n=1 Tax=Sutcliffiella rhizosphaerae TaxID=2880967 RepID=A0ABM8YI99_9BACI|nr:nuclease-related domain-containing protein [Sutcliffiella rhizosphaerae]CAG9619623.1 hypothetical protein BACCIP111883_00391 [Sutcliffiella rhizosphaerae]